MDYMFWVWLGVFVGTFILEIATAELVSIWFTVGSIVPLILSAVDAASWEVQLVIFFLVSAVLILSLRGLMKKLIFNKMTDKTNLDALIGRKVRLQSRTDFETVGSLKMCGVVWGAVEQNGEVIEEGQLVEIVGVRGNKLVVVRAKTEEKQPQEEALQEIPQEGAQEKKETKKSEEKQNKEEK